MENVIVLLIVVGAAATLFWMFKKQAGGDGGCAGESGCQHCPGRHQSSSCPSLSKPDDDSDSHSGMA